MAFWALPPMQWMSVPKTNAFSRAAIRFPVNFLSRYILHTSGPPKSFLSNPTVDTAAQGWRRQIDVLKVDLTMLRYGTRRVKYPPFKFPRGLLHRERLCNWPSANPQIVARMRASRALRLLRPNFEPSHSTSSSSCSLKVLPQRTSQGDVEDSRYG